MPDAKECLKSHPMMHTAAGLGLGLLLPQLVPAVGGTTATWLGLALVVVGVVGEFMVNKK